MSQAVAEEGSALFKKGDYVGARHKYLAALELEGANVLNIQRNLALVNLKLGLPAEALKACIECLKLDPADAKAKYRRVQALLDLEHYVAAWAYMRSVCAELMFAEVDGKITVVKDWQKLHEQCLKGLHVAQMHPAVQLREVGGKQLCLVAATDLPAGTVLLQEARFCKNREQDEVGGGLKSAVDLMLKINQEGGINKFFRELRGLHPIAPSRVPPVLWEQTQDLVKGGLKPGVEEDEIAEIALITLQFNFGRFEDSLYRCSSLMQHSCAPNCDRYLLLNSDAVVTTLRPVKAGSPLTLCFLNFDGMLAGVQVRQHLLMPRFGRPCRCARCCEDLGLSSEEAADPDYEPYGAGGELVRCTTEGCGGYVPFPAIEAANGVSGPCPRCKTTVTRNAVAARYDQFRQGLRAFFPSVILSTGAEIPANPNTSKLTCTQAMAFINVALELGHAWLHPHHHLMRLTYYIMSRITKPVFVTELNRSFGEGMEKTAEDMQHFVQGLLNHRLLERAMEGMDALTRPSPQAPGLAAPFAPTFHAFAEGHTTIVDILRLFIEERATPPGFADLKAAVREAEARLPWCPPQVQHTVQAILKDVDKPKKKFEKPRDPEKERQAQMMEMLQKMAQENEKASSSSSVASSSSSR